jgi:uracil phosphoribosyltransferase
MRKTIKTSTTRELIDALAERKGVEYIETDESEQCEINIATADDALPTHRYHIAGEPGPEVIFRYVPPAEGGS